MLCILLIVIGSRQAMGVRMALSSRTEVFLVPYHLYCISRNLRQSRRARKSFVSMSYSGETSIGKFKKRRYDMTSQPLA